MLSACGLPLLARSFNVSSASILGILLRALIDASCFPIFTSITNSHTMDRQDSFSKLIDLVVTIPGREEYRLVPSISSKLTFAEVLRKLGEVWGVADTQGFTVSYYSHYNSVCETLVLATEEEWRFHFNEDFGWRKLPAFLELTFFKRAAPSETE